MIKNNSVPSDRQKKINDIILITSVILTLIILGICFYYFRGDGDIILVTVDGKEYAKFSLNESLTHDIITTNGTNRLVIENGNAYLSYASCPDGICAAHKPICRSGETIVCLPNKVVITAKVGTIEPTPDVIA